MVVIGAYKTVPYDGLRGETPESVLTADRGRGDFGCARDIGLASSRRFRRISQGCVHGEMALPCQRDGDVAASVLKGIRFCGGEAATLVGIHDRKTKSLTMDMTMFFKRFLM